MTRPAKIRSLPFRARIFLAVLYTLALAITLTAAFIGFAAGNNLGGYAGMLLEATELAILVRYA